MKLPAMPVRSGRDATLNFEKLARQIPVFVESLPVQPSDGQEVYYQNATMAAKGVVWHLRYRAASTSTHKWEFIGGSPLLAFNEEQTGPFVWKVGNLNTWQTNGTCTLTVPLAGEYELIYSALMFCTVQVGIFIGQNGGLAARYEPAAGTWVYATTGDGQGPAMSLPAGYTAKLEWFAENATEQYVRYRAIRLLPIRVG